MISQKNCAMSTGRIAIAITFLVLVVAVNPDPILSDCQLFSLNSRKQEWLNGHSKWLGRSGFGPTTFSKPVLQEI